MKYYSRCILLAVVCAIVPLCESRAASIDDILGRTHLAISPGFTYRLAYEDNIDAERSGKDRISDWSNHYRPSVNISAIGPRFSLASDVELDIAEYINEKNFNYVDQDYTLSLGYLPNERLEFSLGGGYAVQTDNNRIEDIASIDPDQYIRSKDKITDFNAGFSYVLTPRSTIGLTGTYAQYDTISTDKSDFYTLIGVYTYSLGPRTVLLLNTAYFYYDFDGNDRTSDPADDDFFNYSNYSYTLKNYSMTGGFEHKFENDGKLLAQAGMRYSDTDTSQRTDTGTVKTSGNGNGWVAVLEYQKRFNDFLFGFEANQDISVNPEGGNYDSTNFIATTEYNFTRRLTARLKMRYVRAYADSGDDEFLGDRDTRNYIVQPSLQYKLYRWLTTNIGYQFRYSQYKEENEGSAHSNLFFIDFRFIPLRKLVLR